MSITILDNVENIDNSGKCILKFSAKWCGPCKVISPFYKSLSGQYKNIKFCEVDVDEAIEIADKYNVESMPTFIALVNGKEIQRISGAEQGKLRNFVQALHIFTESQT